MATYNVVSFSGGKDSTAVLFGMLEKGIPVGEVIFFDTGWEFPEMYNHLSEVERRSGISITRLRPKRSFYYWAVEADVKFSRGEMKGTHRRWGNGWPSPFRRGCTRIKTRAIDQYLQGRSWVHGVSEITQCIGFAADEKHRTTGKEITKSRWANRFPLIEWGWDEAQALAYCKKLGFTWGGLYDIFHRVSCYCCPLQSLDNLRALRQRRPNEWRMMLELEGQMDQSQLIRFHHEASVHALDLRFAEEDLLK